MSIAFIEPQLERASYYLSGRTETHRTCSRAGTRTVPGRLRYGPEAITAAAHASERFEKVDRVEESGRGQPHSKTWRTQFDPVPRGSASECGCPLVSAAWSRGAPHFLTARIAEGQSASIRRRGNRLRVCANRALFRNERTAAVAEPNRSLWLRQSHPNERAAARRNPNTLRLGSATAAVRCSSGLA
jgi:hypothetical protein